MSPTSRSLSRRAYLGAELPGDAEAFTPSGIRIAGVADGSMAARAGLCAGDLLVSLAAIRVHDLRTLSAALRAAGHTPTTEVVFDRDGARHSETVDVIALPHEGGAHYDELAVDGAHLRTLATEPPEPRALVLVVQGIACESIDHALDRDTPLAAFVDGLTSAGYATLRFDKRGVGDSTGEIADFTTELADARAVHAHARALAAARGVPLIVFGHSVGGIIAAQLRDADAIIVYGTPVMRWLDCLLDSTERQLALRGAPRAEIEQQLAAIRTLAERGELNGRSAAYHEQLHALDLEAAWRAVTTPVLVVRGEHDWVVRADDQGRIAELARGATTIIDLPHLDHLFGRHPDRDASLRDYGIGRADPSLASATVAWLDRVRSSS